MKKRIILFVLVTSLLLSLCACTNKKVYTVNFDTDGGSFVAAQNVNENAKVVEPKSPTKDGYEFVEWQLDGNKYDFSSPVTKDIILKAVYSSGSKVNKCTVIIEDEKYTVEFNEGETPKINTPQSKKGDSFVGWKIDGVEGPLSNAKDGSTIEAIFETVSKDIPCTAIKMDYNSYYTVEGTGAWQLEVKLEPENTTDKLSFTSEDENIVKVDQKGFVTAQNVGNTKIHIKCGNIEKVIKFETRAKKVKVTSVTAEPSYMKVYIDGTNQIKATVEPSNATDKTVTYKSSDPSIADVDGNGIVYGHMPGNCTIYVTAGDKTANCAVSVEGEVVMFAFENYAYVQAASGQKVPYKAIHISCYDGQVNKEDVSKWCTLNTAYTSAIDLDGAGNIVATGGIYETTDIPFNLIYTDGSSFYQQSQTFYIHVVK